MAIRGSFMRPLIRAACFLVLTAIAPGALTRAARAADPGWIDLTGSGNFDAWKAPTEAWAFVGEVQLDPENPKKLVAKPGTGTGILYNGPSGRTRNLVTKQEFRDIEAHVEFLIPKGSNSGVKFDGVYEIQILDSAGKKVLSGNDLGGIYPRAESKPKYHYLDEGHPPRVNAALPAGEWQTLDVIFHAPRFDASGRKVASARFVKVVLNGQVIHENAEAATPTGSAWVKKETPTGPLLIQADHGPVAIRNVRVRPLESSQD
jgi:hypothetical protein